jgi:hypothetical protein
VKRLDLVRELVDELVGGLLERTMAVQEIDGANG